MELRTIITMPSPSTGIITMRNAQWIDSQLRKSHILLVCLALVLNGCIRVSPPLREAETARVQTDPTTLPELTIAAVQGAGHFSPYENQQVENVTGIVTVIRADGFYMQSITPDDNPATSEGIYVYQGLVPSVRPGDHVRVSAVVKEIPSLGDAVNHLAITTLSYPTVAVLSSRNPLPTPVVIGTGGRMPPTEIIAAENQGGIIEENLFDTTSAGMDFYESLEGTLVQVNNAVVVGATNPFKEIVILPDGGAWAGVRTPRGGIVVREGDFNPERIILDDALIDMPFVQVGDYAIAPIIGVMDYTYGNYKLQPIEDVAFRSGDLQPSLPLPPTEPRQVRVASYNVEVLYARQAGRLVTLADHIVNVMASPEIIGLQEVADNDGPEVSQVISADFSYQGIITAILDMGGPPYGFVNIDPVPDQDGGVPGANIRLGFLYRLDRGIQLVDAPQGDSQTAVGVTSANGLPLLSHNPGRIDPNNPAFTNSRKPLVAQFLIEGQSLFVINNHFNAKRADHALFGAVQPPVLHSEAQRLRQAQLVQNFVLSILAINPHSRVIVLGDLNDFHFSAPVQTLKGENLFNLIETLPVPERYTYIYDGNSQVLDHILVSERLLDTLAAFNILHLNSEFDYWRQFSDHDPVVATFWWQ
jgi:uncharacterized protein